MRPKKIQFLILSLFVAGGIAGFIHSSRAQVTVPAFSPTIPRVWDDEAILSLEVPLPDAGGLSHASLG